MNNERLIKRKDIFDNLYINASNRILTWLFFINAGAAVAVLAISSDNISFISIIISAVFFTIGTILALFNAFHHQSVLEKILLKINKKLSEHESRDSDKQNSAEDLVSPELNFKSLVIQHTLNILSFVAFILGGLTILISTIIVNCICK